MGNTGRTPTQLSVLPLEVEQALAEAIAPIDLASEQRQALRARLLHRVQLEQPRFVTIRSTDGSWVPLLPKVAMKILDDDGNMQSFLLRLDPGGRLPAHDHHDDELCVVLEGSVRLGALEVNAGDFHLARAGSSHGELVSDDGAVLFLRTRLARGAGHAAA